VLVALMRAADRAGAGRACSRLRRRVREPRPRRRRWASRGFARRLMNATV